MKKRVTEITLGGEEADIENPSEDYSYLKHLISDKGAKSEAKNKIVQLFHDLVFNNEAAESTAKQTARLLLNVEVKTIEEIFETNWIETSAERRNLVLKELLALPSEKGFLRQVAVAQKLASIDKEIAAQILFYMLTNGKPEIQENEFPVFSKDKNDTLHSRFFSPNNKWITFESSDKRILRRLLSSFVAMALDIEAFGKDRTMGIAHQFSRWALLTFNHADFSEDDETRLRKQVDSIISRLPQRSKDELNTIDKEREKAGQEDQSNVSAEESIVSQIPEVQSEQMEPASTGEGAVSYDLGQVESTPEVLPETQNAEPQPQPSRKSKGSAKTQPESQKADKAEQLLKEKLAALAQLTLETQILQELVSERESLKQTNAQLKNQLFAAEDESDRHQENLQKFKTKFDSLEQALKDVEAERTRLSETHNSLRSEFARNSKALEQKTQELVSERREYVENSKREVEMEIASFKGNLKQKLRPIFENKNQTNDDPLSEKLAEFLRKWSKHVENALRDSGIDL